MINTWSRGDGNLFGSRLFYKNTIPSIVTASIAAIIVFKGNKKWIQGCTIFTFVYLMILIFFGPNEK